jgi:hypothetical protein
MRKVKLDTESEKSADVSFNRAKPGENEALSFAGSPKMSVIKKDEGFGDEHGPFVRALKQLCLFLPGTFLLFFMSFGAAIIAMEIIVYRRPSAMLPDDYPFQFALIGLIGVLGTFMTWYGLGDIKNRKHFAVPASLMITGAIIGVAVKATAIISDLADRMLDDFRYLIYLLPFALIIPILAKRIVDRKTRDA